jgi:hypothetical protein
MFRVRYHFGGTATTAASCNYVIVNMAAAFACLPWYDGVTPGMEERQTL